MLKQKKKIRNKPIIDDKTKNYYNTIITSENNNQNENTKNLLYFLLEKNIPNKKTKEKINNNDLFQLKFHDYEALVNINYNLNQLKLIAKDHNIKVSGNKEELKKRIYNFLFISHNSIIIQKNYRRKLIYKYIELHGPGFKNRKLCTNDKDFCTLDEIKDIPYNQFFSFKDDNDFIYAFDIYSLYNLYKKNNSITTNPFSTKPLPSKIFNNLKYYIKISSLLNIKINIDFEELEIKNENKKMEIKILSIFQNMDALGNYTSISWFNNLNKMDLILFLKELIDIWNYRANLSINIKREICPPHGNPFRELNINIHNITSYNTNLIKKNIVNIMEIMVNNGINNDSKALGCYYILCALTLVNSDAAESLPWLYESVNYNNNIN
tara:strand:- start:1046 stop:2188 length:1143 start_codon:yes stop_codon:yes gene_type:complete